MSSQLFKYVLTATDSDQEEMKLSVSADVRSERIRRISEVDKCDDLGDALLYTIDQILCGSPNLCKISAPVNNHPFGDSRTVVVMVLPDILYYVVVSCSLNNIIFDYLNSKTIHLGEQFYKRVDAVRMINDCITDTDKLELAQNIM
jgi:hypothetical protein